MELVKKSKEYSIYKKRNGRFSVLKGRKYINGGDKVSILLKEGLIVAKAPKKEAAETASEAPAEQEE